MNKTRLFRFSVVALVGLLPTSFLGVAVATSSAKVLTTTSARTAVAGRDFTTLYKFDPRGAFGARVGPMVFREDGSAVIDNVPLAGPGEFLTQSQIGIQSGKTRTWFLAQSGAQPRQAYAASSKGQSIVWLETKDTDLYYQAWPLYSGTIGKPRPLLLADSFSLLKTDQIPYPPGVTTLSTDGVNAWWVMVYPTKKAARG